MSRTGRPRGSHGHVRSKACRLVALLVVLAACTGTQDPGADVEPTDAPAQTEASDATESDEVTDETGTTEPPGDPSVLTVGIPTLDTLEFTPATSDGDPEKQLMLMGDNLVAWDPEAAEFVGQAATSWSLSDDGTTWTFELRPDVPFHDGLGAMTADDVKWSWEQWAGEESIHSSRPIYQQAIGGDMDNFEVVSDLEFRLHTDEPVTDLLGAVCSCLPGMTVFPQSYYEEMGDEANAHPVGTGPWQYVSSSLGEELVLERFSDYWDQVPSVDQVVFKEIPDASARLLQVQSGTLDLGQLDGPLVSEAQASGLDLIGIPNVRNAFVILGGSYWGHEGLDDGAPWIQADTPEQGLAVREAMSLAIDRETILQVALTGFGQLTYAPLVADPNNPALVDPSWELPEYDPELARQRLADGGYPNGFEVTMPMHSDDFDTLTMAELIAGMWEEIGLTVTRMPIDDDLLEEQEDAMDTDGMAYVSTITMLPEPSQPLLSYTTKDVGEGSTKFFHPSIDEAHAALATETDRDERMRITRDMLSAIRDEYIALTLMAGDMVFAAGPRVESWEPIAGINTVNALETVTLSGS